jgi:hypothetical protein
VIDKLRERGEREREREREIDRYSTFSRGMLGEGYKGIHGLEK